MFEILLDTFLDLIKTLPFLFLAYLIIELIEYTSEDKSVGFIKDAKKFGPFVGSLLGTVPQCGFSAATSNLYAGGLISRGTLIAVFLSNSDEMLPILISSDVSPLFIVKVILSKIFVAFLAGTLIEYLERKYHFKKDIKIGNLCEQEHCDCEHGVFKSAIIHTLKIAIFLFITSLVISIIVETIGTDTLEHFIMNKPIIGNFLAGIIGLIPNCASSVIITQLYLHGGISAGAMLSGLFVGCGIGVLVLFRVNKSIRDNLITVSILYVIGVLAGIVIGLLPLF